MSPDQIRHVRSVLGLSQRELARALGVAPYTVSRWEAGQSPPSGLQLEVLRALHSTALRVQDDQAKVAIVAGLVGLGIGALIFYLLTQEAG